MKIVFDARVHLNYFSGISRYIICLLEAYAHLYPKDQITVLLNPTIAKDNSIYNVLGQFPNITFKTIDAGHMGPKNYTVMGKIIRKMAPDVYHYPHLDAPVFTGKVPVVATIHDTNSNNRVKKFDDKLGLKSFYFSWSLSQTLKRASKVIFVSESVKKEVEEDFKIPNREKLHVIYNGLESDFNRITPDESNAIINELGCSTPYLLYVGQIREHKNIFRIVDAFKQFHGSNSEYHLLVVGHNYLQLDLNSDSIRHIEKVSNKTLKALYANCSALLFPSLFEGFGFPVLEAFSFGRPVITTNYGATKEISSDLASLVDPKSVDSIVDGIERALKQTNQEEARKKHAASFSWENHAKKLREVYLGAIESK